MAPAHRSSRNTATSRGVEAALLCLLWVSIGSAAHSSGDNPYQPGSLKTISFTLTKGERGIPEHSVVFSPTAGGIYVPLLFVPGLNGIVYTELYTDFLNYVSSHGYIVVGVDLGWPAARRWKGKTSLSDGPAVLFETLRWLDANLNQVILPTHGVSNVSADWAWLGAFSHSSGADDLLRMLQNSSFAKAVVFLEPFSFNFDRPLPYSIPALSFGTQLCTEAPACCINGWDYFDFYAKLRCPRMLMNVTGYGHCDILNDIGWDACNAVHFCKTDPSNNRPLYKLFVQGVVTAFMDVYIQGNQDLLKFITDESLMPLELGLLEYDLTC